MAISGIKMKIVLRLLKNAMFVFGSYVGFAYLWLIFRFAVNPYLVFEIIEHGYRQSPLHLLAVDTLDFLTNWPVCQWWMLAAFVFFSWLSWKKPDRAGWRRIGLAVYIVPYVALTALFVSASLVQEKEPIQISEANKQGEK